MKVLIVDDTVFMRMTIRKILEENGITVVAEAADGFEAVLKYKKYRPDLTIMDISMPKMDGIECVKQIIDYDASASIIMCSLQGQRTNVMEAIKAGAKSYLVKPVKEEKLIREIQKVQYSASPTQSITKNLLSNMMPKSEPQTCSDSEVRLQEDAELRAEAEAEAMLCELSAAESHSEDFIKGLEQGYSESKREIATNMIRAGISMDVITACVELSEEQVLKFKEEYHI